MRRRTNDTTRKRSRTILNLLGASFSLTLGTLLVLRALHVPLGQGYFFYRYSPFAETRVVRCAPLLIVAALAAGGVWLLARKQRIVLAKLLLILALVGSAAWVWWAPPSPIVQHFFNLTSFSSDGAFVMEGAQIPSIASYLRNFDRDRLTRSPENLRGTRVLSNPPGASALAAAMLKMLPIDFEHPGLLDRPLTQAVDVQRDYMPFAGTAMRFGVALLILWALSGVVAYFLGREMRLSPAGAAAFAIVVTFNPAAVAFSPGKDPAQLLTINAMLWAWLAGLRRGSPLLSAAVGAILAIGAAFGLIHFWVALAVLVATLWQSWREGNLSRMAFRNLAPAIAGGLAMVLIIYLATGWNEPATLLAVSRSFARVQTNEIYPKMNRLIWFAIGLPLFALFLSPGFWTFAARSVRRQYLNFPMRLMLCTLATMLFIYLVAGVTYELPRLWVAFVPPLTLAVAAGWPTLRGSSDISHPRVAKLLAIIVIVQILTTGLHWSLLDVRESEYRLASKRFYN